MRLKNIITFSVLFALSFSMVHEFVFSELDENKCSVSEYVLEFDAPTGADDICDIHFEYHQAAMFPQKSFSILDVDRISELIIKKESYDFSINQDLIIPPIS